MYAKLSVVQKHLATWKHLYWAIPMALVILMLASVAAVLFYPSENLDTFAMVMVVIGFIFLILSVDGPLSERVLGLLLSTFLYYIGAGATILFWYRVYGGDWLHPVELWNLLLALVGTYIGSLAMYHFIWPIRK